MGNPPITNTRFVQNQTSDYHYNRVFQQPVKERNSPAEAAGQGEEVISVWIDTDEVVDKGYIRRFNGTRTPPDPKKLIGDDSKPVTFDPETDVLDLEGIGGAHGTWQTWKVVRRYRTVLMIRIKYQATRQKGKCKQLFEV